MTDPTKQQRIAAVIRGLLAKTQENGATEAEAVAAASKAFDLLEKYQLDLSDVELKAEGVKQGKTGYHTTTDGKTSVNKGLGIRFIMIRGVGAFTDCESWRYGTDEINFLGLPSDVDFATYLLDSLTAFTLNQTETYCATLPPYLDKARRWQERKSFAIGCARRICQRLERAADARKVYAPSSGRSLVVIKGQMITAEMARLGIKLHHRRTNRAVSADAYHAGQRAGEGAGFNRPLNGGAGVKLLQ